LDLKQLYWFNGTVCLADARYFHRYPAKNIAFRQLAVADSVIITKSEDLNQTQKDKFTDELRIPNPLAGFHISDFGHVSDFDLESIQHKIKLTPSFGTEHNKHEYLQVKTIKIEKPLHREQFTDWFSYNFDLYKTEIYRVKGILHFENEPYLFVLQGVGGSFEITESDMFASEMKSEIVLIGRLKNVDFEYLY
jgi:G3E family GTPase